MFYIKRRKRKYNRKILKTKKVEIVNIEFKEIENLPKLPTEIQGTICVKPTEEYEGFFVAKLKKI